MAVVTVIMAVVLGLYIKNTGTVPAADNAASLTDGIYTSSAQGCLSDVTVTVTVTVAGAGAGAEAVTVTVTVAGAFAVAEAGAFAVAEAVSHSCHTGTPSMLFWALSVMGMISMASVSVTRSTSQGNLQFCGLLVPSVAS